MQAGSIKSQHAGRTRFDPPAGGVQLVALSGVMVGALTTCARAALLSLAFLLLHTFAMPVAFDGLDRKRPAQWAAVPAVHLGAALLVRLVMLCH